MRRRRVGVERQCAYIDCGCYVNRILVFLIPSLSLCWLIFSIQYIALLDVINTYDKASLLPILSSRKNYNSNKKIKITNLTDTTNENILQILNDAKIESLDEERVKRLPTWENITSMYGDRPVFHMVLKLVNITETWSNQNTVQSVQLGCSIQAISILEVD